MAPDTIKAAGSGKANYRSYEAQARLVRAIVAAHPKMKWDYKEIAACYGSDMTGNALNHRFRHLKAEALIIEEGRKQGFDMKNLAFEGNLPATQGAVDIDEIAKYFGQSTADGIQFQFRTIKKDAEKLRKIESEGGDVASALTADLNNGTSTPGTVTPSKPTPRRRAPASTSTKRGRIVQEELDFIKPEASDGEPDEDTFAMLSAQTPSKKPKMDHDRTPLPQKQNNSTLAVRASATPSRSGRAPEANPDNSQATIDLDTPPSSASISNVAASIFGAVSPKANKANGGDRSNDHNDFNAAFKSSGVDAYVGSQNPSTSMYTNASFSFADGEI